MFRLLHLFDRVKMKVFIVNFTISFLHPFHQQLFYVSHTQSLFGCVLFGNIPTYLVILISVMVAIAKVYPSLPSTILLLLGTKVKANLCNRNLLIMFLKRQIDRDIFDSVTSVNNSYKCLSLLCNNNSKIDLS